MPTATCHCGAITITIPSLPEKATSCNCSICRRYATIWGYFDYGAINITGHPEHTESYMWGDKTLRFVRCLTCGCVTHWERLNATPESRCGVNLRNLDPQLMEKIKIRRLDGADTWKFLD